MKTFQKITVVAFIGTLPLLGSCFKNTEGKTAKGMSVNPQAAAAPVLAAKAVVKTVPVQLQAFGNAEAFSTVSIKSQITGQLMTVHFKEGQAVKKGDLLFTIDPRPLQAALSQAQDKLSVDQAKLNFARNETRRYENQAKSGSAAQQKFEQARSASDALEAAVRADKAAIDTVKIQLEYCFIHSPIDGITGNLLVHEVNIVKANDVDLVTINQVTPILIKFAVPQQYLSDIQKFMKVGPIKDQAASARDHKPPVEGTLSFVNNTIDLTTGTVTLKATFANENHALWPGEFLRVTLFLTSQPNAVVVPSRAVQTGQSGSFVFVIKPDMSVETRQVTLGRVLGEETVIQEGIEADQTVVTDGQLRLMPGGKVQIKQSLTDNGQGAK